MSSKDRLPEITHLQFVVLGLLVDESRAGRDIRVQLRRHGVSRTAPAFYQMMARLEDAGFVEGWYDQKVIEGQLIKERHYRLRPAGLRAWRGTRDFYMAALGPLKVAREHGHG
jgi:DNA-binding PadR family transcriptional regulator